MKGNICVRALGYVFLWAFFTQSAISAFAQVYQYRDKNGLLHFTNELSEIPEDQKPKVIMEQPEKAAEPQATEGPAPEKSPLETDKTMEPSSEKPPAESPDNPKEIPIVEDLNKEKAALDKIHAQLMKRKRDLQKEKETLKTPEQVRKYQKKTKRLNREIDVYKKRNKAFQKKADAYNAALREKGDE